MHGRLQLPGADRSADFSNEGSALATMGQQFTGLVDIACRLKLDDLDIDFRGHRRETPGDFLGLGQGHGALACADPQSHQTHARCLDMDMADGIGVGPSREQ